MYLYSNFKKAKQTETWLLQSPNDFQGGPLGYHKSLFSQPEYWILQGARDSASSDGDSESLIVGLMLKGNWQDEHIS